ncbi:hypothetical protein J23TS9_53730 [Paenibacillus sp. J23TS9]|nr:hypothetical protein J23TS9_53730 [Paenibacillus sp. J23TS9]
MKKGMPAFAGIPFCAMGYFFNFGSLGIWLCSAISIVNDSNKAGFIETLLSRLDDIEKDTKRKRVEKVIKKWS